MVVKKVKLMAQNHIRIHQTTGQSEPHPMLGSQVAQLVGCWTYNPRVVGSIPSDANCFMWDNILGQDVNLDCALLSRQACLYHTQTLVVLCPELGLAVNMEKWKNWNPNRTTLECCWTLNLEIKT